MTVRTLWIAAENINDARIIAYALDAGRLTIRKHHTDADEAERFAQLCTRMFRRPIKVFAIVIEHRTVDDGRIPVAWAADKLGDAAAAFLITCAGPFAVGLATLCERIV